MATISTKKTVSLDELTTTKTEEQEFPLVISEILAEHMERVERTETTNLAEYVSNELAQEYPRISQKMYKLERDVTLIPNNAEIIINSFLEDNNCRDINEVNFTYSKPQLTLIMPLVLGAAYEKEEVINLNLDRCTSPSITYCIKNITHNGAINYGGWKTVSISHSEYVSNGHYSGKHEFHDVKLDGNKGDQNITIMGTWTSRGTVESCKVKVPEVPEVASDRISEAQAKYFSLLSDVKRRGKFKGKTLLQPEIYIVWIPTEDQFELKVKEVLRPVVVSTDPALILRIGKQYDHVVALWDGPNEIPLEGIIRKYMK